MTHNNWPALDYKKLEKTHHSLHMWMQIVGKLRLAATPWVNHSWHATLYPCASGMTTSLIHGENYDLEVLFDFHQHKLRLITTDGRQSEMKLESMAVADFYKKFNELLKELKVYVEIHHKPNEVFDIPAFLEQTETTEYDPQLANDFWQALLRSSSVFNHFRTSFLGKVSRVHFFWGSADLAV
ncbi:MAG: DUF5996 family protein, partial [Bdellovibrionales bacterium]|nr:DUF5996 family protein [Bdellovibrionales bacterium]